jgi:beta-lactamase regulating signal transducer with metallopeptidase domain
MNSTSLAIGWVQLLALLAAEVGLVALGVALVRRWCPSAAWHRTFCQVGIAAVLVVTVCELSGSARVFGGWAASVMSRQQGESPTVRRKVSLEAEGAPAFLPARSWESEVAGKNAGAPSVPRSAAIAEQPLAKSLPAVLARPVTPSPSAVQNSRSANDASSTPRFPSPFLAITPVAPASRPPDAVADSMAVLWLCLIWATGAALAGARVCLAQCLFLIFQLRRRPVAEPALVTRVQALAWSLGIRRRVRVLESRRLTSPIAFGLIQPAVGLPPNFTRRFDAARQDAMLAHELAHLAALDPFWCLLADAAAVLLWWHPGVWWLRRQLHLASEMAADEASLLVADGPRILAECLVELGARLTRSLPLGQLRVSGFRSHLGRRVQHLVHLEGRAWSPLPRLGTALVKVFGPLAMTAIVVLCTAWAAPQELTKGDSMKTIQLNWKRSLATFALLAAFNGPDATVAVARPDTPPAPPAAPPEVTPAPPATRAVPSANAPAAELPPAPNPPAGAAAEDAFARRPGLRNPPSALPDAPEAANFQQADDAIRKRYGLPPGAIVRVPAAAPRPPAAAAPGAKVEAKLKQIVLDEVKFDGLPLSEVLLYLNEQSMKRDPDKIGVNFLINPNFRPVSLRDGVDPTTGLPLAAAPEQFDVGAVVIKFNMPLRHVTMKDVLDAIVTVADHPIGYTLEDYGVVFAAKPEMLAGEPVVVAPAGLPSEPSAPALPGTTSGNPTPAPPNNPFASKVETPRKSHQTSVELEDVKPQPFNVDFGPAVGTASEQVGPAAAGKKGEFWNTVTIPFNDHHTEGELKFAGGDPSPIEVEMINLGGACSARGLMGVKSPMFDTYDYPTANKGGDSTVILHHVPAGKYQVYIYGHGLEPLYYGDYTLSVAGHEYGRKNTFHKDDAGQKTKWVEGSQYVKFSNVKVGADQDMEILIRPGGEVSAPSGRTFADAIIFGLQLIPVK